MKILVINGHPRQGSFSEAITDAYINGALESGAKVEVIHLYKLTFERDVIERSPRRQALEDCLVRSQGLLFWCDHVVFIFPTWWGTMPGILKSFLDRILVQGFAFNEIEGGTGYEPLLKGRSGELITTMDTPSFVYRLIYGAPGLKMMRKATLGFCGISPVKFKKIGPLRNSTKEQRAKWLGEVRRVAMKRNNKISRVNLFSSKLTAWLKAIRLQFYPMTWIAYACGAFAAEKFGYGYDRKIFWSGYIWLFLLEVSTVLFNEYFDYRSDKQNRYFGPFNGGSRVIVEGELTIKQVYTGAITTFLLSIPFFIYMLSVSPGDQADLIISGGILIILAIGYTMPPLKLSYRTLGELTVGITHSVAVIVCGYLFQGGNINDAFPWLVSIPLFLSVLPSIILAGIPDYEADRVAGKRTIAVRFGTRNAAAIAMLFTILSAIAGMVISNIFLKGTYGYIFYMAIPHAILLSLMLYRYIKSPEMPGRIDRLIITALTYLVWFAVTAL